MNVYDFDGTIYRGDSSFDFYFFALSRHLSVLLDVPALIGAGIRYKCKKIDKSAFKEAVFSFLKRLENTDGEVKAFWDKNEKKLYSWYLEQKQNDDVIISASPEFLLEEICRRKEINGLIATRVDPKTGAFNGKNCRDEEKVVRFRKIYPNAEIENFYSDSYCDAPMARLAKKAYLIKRGKVVSWEN